MRITAYFVLAVMDVAIIVLSYFLASDLYVGSARALGGLSSGRFAPLYSGSTFTVVGYACVIVCLYAVLRVYGCIYMGQLRKMVQRIVAVNFVGVILFAAMLYFLHMDDVSRMTLAIFCLISTVAIIAKNLIAYRIFLAMRNNAKRIVETIVVGNGPLAERYVSTVSSNPTRFEHVIGYVSPHTEAEPAKITVGNESCEIPCDCLGLTEEMDEILAGREVDKIVIALEPADYHQVQSVMAMADKYGTMLDLVPFYNDVMPRRPDIDSVGDVRLVNLRSMPLSNPANAAAKRFADIVISGTIIVTFSWLYVITAIGVKATSPGPVFFKQRRVGRNNKPFDMLKFRSMRVNDESETAWSTDEDPRKTKFGSFIRKFSIDEFPQFFNVFLGDMSIVGPRPEIPYYVDGFRESVPKYMLRHQIRPGITGWAQVSGLRGDTSIEKRIDADLWYIEHWSALLDIRIFMRTIFGGFINSEKLLR